MVPTVLICRGEENVHARLPAFTEFVHAILSEFHVQEKLPSIHVQFFPVYVLALHNRCS